MNPEARRASLLDHLMACGQAQVGELATLLGVSRMTVHRDLDLLAARRIVRKVRGGVTVRPSVVFESDFAYRAQIQLVEKRALARRAASLIEPGAAIVLDDSTTVGELVPHLRAIRPLTVITNARDVINALAGLDEISLIALGGHFDPRTNAFFGALGEGALTQLRADLAFLSTPAVKGHRAYLHDEDVLRLKQAMMRVAEQRILLVDHSKFGKSALNLFADLADFDRVFVGDRLARTDRDVLEAAGVRLEVVPL